MGLGAWGPPAVFLPAWGTVDLALECDLVIKREKDYKFERAHDEAKMSRHRKFGREQKADGWWYDKPWIPAVKSVSFQHFAAEQSTNQPLKPGF